jgi:competence protein ComEC
MQIFFFLFFIGVISLFLFYELPSLPVIFLILVICLLLFGFKIKSFRYLGMLGLGCFWVLLNSYLIKITTLPSYYENHPVVIQGVISSIPIFKQSQACFDYQIETLQGKTWHAKIHLCYKQCSFPLHVGESWHFLAKLKRPHSLMNPGGVDTERNYFLKRIIALGIVVPGKENFILHAKRKYLLEQIREFIFFKITGLCSSSDFVGILLALTLGMTHLITPQQWEIFRQTGTNHLVAISGLHIGLVAALTAKMTGFIWNRVPNGPLIIPTSYLSAWCSVLMALVYCLLAGLSPSTLRALLMILFLTTGHLLKRQVTTLQSLLFSLGMIMLFQPLAVLSTGFWLSFLAVFLIIFCLHGRYAPSGLWWQWGRAQWVIGIGMLPTLLWLFQQATLLSFPANFLAIPWFSFLVVPCCLLSAIAVLLLGNYSVYLLHSAIWLIKIIWYYLEKLVASGSSFIWHQAFINAKGMIFAYIATLTSLTPQGLISRVLPIFLLLPTLNGVKLSADMQIVVLDVGQGLAIFIRTRNHNLLFDTGAKINEVQNMGKLVIIPYLIQLGIKHLDVLTISHGDNDHIGGSYSILKELQVSQIITGVPERFKNYHPIMCRENLSWSWDGVNFKFLSPPRDSLFVGNNASCVLKVSIGSQSVLLTADIEKPAEEELIKRHKTDLPATILIAPHHGSKTSSSNNFIKAVKPKYVIFSCGYLNTYHHPHLQTINRYSQQQCTLLSTVTSGAITMTLSKDSDKVVVQKYREKYQKLWH